MSATGDSGVLPERLRAVFSLAMTVLAAILYAGVLGSAIVRAFLEANPVFSEGTVRTASLLSGLVGSVVTAGFARGNRPASVPITTTHPLGGRAVTAWSTLKPPSLWRCKLLGLAGFLGFRAGARAADGGAPDLEPGMGMSTPLWVALLYFVLYFLVGASAFALTLLRDATPDFLVNSAWVWLGTVLSSGYSFFALGNGTQVMPVQALRRGRLAAARRTR